MGVTGPSKEWWRLHIVTVLWLDLLSHLHRQLQQKADAKSAGPIWTHLLLVICVALRTRWELKQDSISISNSFCIFYGLSQSVPAELPSTEQAGSICCPSPQGFSTLGKGLRHLPLDLDSTSSQSTLDTSSSPATPPLAASRRHLLTCSSFCAQRSPFYAHSSVQRIRLLLATILSQLNLTKDCFWKDPESFTRKYKIKLNI